MRSVMVVASILCIFVMSFSISVQAAEPERVIVTVLSASNEGNDFNLENDAYKDKLIELFSYSAYEQLEQTSVELSRAERNTIALLENCELVLTLQGTENGRIVVEAVIRKDHKEVVNTVISILKPGAAFLGGPILQDEKALILVLEAGY